VLPDPGLKHRLGEQMTRQIWIIPFADLDADKFAAGGIGSKENKAAAAAAGRPDAGTGFLAGLATAAGSVFGLEAHLGQPLLLPANAYNRRREQYRAETFLEGLAGRRETGALGTGSILLGVTGLDLFVPKLNFVFGLAEPARGVAVISLCRLRPEFYGAAADEAALAERAIKEAVHELGHVSGLPHCRNPECIMHFSNSIADTDSKGPGFCERCAGRRF